MNQANDPEFWRERYRTGQTGWDLGAPSPNLQRLVREHASPGARVLVPGCGRGHDARALAKAGFAVTGLDVAPEALEDARTLAAREGLSVDWVEADLFAANPGWIGRFDVWAELTCFCAIDPARRAEYVRQAKAWLRPGGLFIGVIFINLPPGGPPFTSTPEEIDALFSDGFVRKIARMSPDSVPARQGKEWEVVYERS